MKEGDFLYGTVGILGFFGIAKVCQMLDSLLSSLFEHGHDIAELIGVAIIVWGGMGCLFITIKAFKGGFGRFGDATQT
jgi:hypothetical protein